LDFDIDVEAFFEKYGIIKTLLLMAISTSFPYIFKYIWNKIFNSKKKKEMANLAKHPFFHQIENIISVKIPAMQFNDCARTQIFRDMLTILFRSYSDAMKKILADNFDRNGELTFESDEDFNQKLSNNTINAITTYENLWSKSAIPLVCIEKFGEWHSKKRDLIFSDIQTISNSQFYSTYVEKLAAYFDSVYAILNISVLDAEFILRSINGQLTGQSYKGVEIGPEDDKCVIRTSDEESDAKLPIPSYVKKKSELLEFKEEPKPPKKK
jgi:hypothetical protein